MKKQVHSGPHHSNHQRLCMAAFTFYLQEHVILLKLGNLQQTKININNICICIYYILEYYGTNMNFDLCRCSDEKNPRVKPYIFSNQKLKDLGLEFTPVKQCLYDTVKNLQENGHLPVPPKQEDSY